jgi:hypothetical protein
MPGVAPASLTGTLSALRGNGAAKARLRPSSALHPADRLLSAAPRQRARASDQCSSPPALVRWDVARAASLRESPVVRRNQWGVKVIVRPHARETGCDENP